MLLPSKWAHPHPEERAVQLLQPEVGGLTGALPRTLEEEAGALPRPPARLGLFLFLFLV